MAVDDITVETQARRLQEAENRVLEMIGTGAALSSILETLVLAIEEHARPAVASVVLLDAQGLHVRHAAAPHLPESYCRAIDGLPIGPTAGSCGTAAFLRRAVFVEDIATDPLWASYRHLALAAGLRACSSTPIVAMDGRVLGTFAFYYLEPRVPTDGDRELIERATHLAGIAIERAQVEEQLRALSARVESVREDERTGIAREIHDELGQSLTALKMDLAWIGRRLSNESDVSPECLLEKLRAMSDMTDDVIRQVRRISAELRPGVLDDLGLLAAIEWQAQEFEKRTSTTCIVHSNMDAAQLARDLSTAVFRIFQEALTNVARHAEANRVDVRLYHGDGYVRLEVTDDGKGISSESLRSPSSLGLLGIRERARRLGGTATIRGVDPRGTSVSLDLPVGSSQDAERT
jgi:signal transduction histidine kinase